MKKLCVFWVLMLSIMSMQAQTLESVLAGYHKAIGGLDKYPLKGSVIIKAKSQGGGGGEKRPMSFTFKAPNKSRMDYTIQPGLVYTRAFDGVQGWTIQPWTGSMEPQPLNADDSRDAKRMIKTMWNDLILNGSDGTKLEYTGKDEIEGSEVFVVNAKHTDGTVMVYYLDVDSYLLIKIVTKSLESGILVESEMFPGDYEIVDGRTLPFTLESKSNGESNGSTFVQHYDFSSNIDDVFFMIPVKH